MADGAKSVFLAFTRVDKTCIIFSVTHKLLSFECPVCKIVHHRVSFQTDDLRNKKHQIFNNQLSYELEFKMWVRISVTWHLLYVNPGSLAPVGPQVAHNTLCSWVFFSITKVCGEWMESVLNTDLSRLFITLALHIIVTGINDEAIAWTCASMMFLIKTAMLKTLLSNALIACSVWKATWH